MKKLFWLVLPALAFLVSCSNKFKVGAPYKEVTAVYCLLSKTDTAHYVKVVKGFYDEVLDNLLLAQNVDSIYYDSLDVKFEEINNGSVVATFPLTKVNLINEGYIKKDGVFAITPSYAYKFTASLNPSRTYRLIVKNVFTGKTMTAETSVISDQLLKVEYPLTIDDGLNFSNYLKDYSFIFSAPTNAVICDVQLRFYYSEKNVLKPDSVSKKYVDLTLANNILNPGGQIRYAFPNINFFRILNSELGAAPENIIRLIDTPDVVFLGGGSVLKTYMDVQLAQGGGITYDQIKPTYTNFTGDDVYGILSTRVVKRIKGIPFTSSTVDSMINGIYTKNLNIVGVTPD